MTAELRGRASKILPRRFYRGETATVARDLLGKVLRVRNGRIWRSGVIVETEAYVSNDPANHAYRGPNRRNQSMFKQPGTVYVYPIHRVHCVNVVTRKGEAVLIRALHALNNVSSSTIGPGLLCRALNITRSRHDGLSFDGSEIQITKHDYAPFEIAVSKRIGISKAKEMRLRFFAKDNPYVSR
jgi:DNA-3-methyladenine glycosylase